MIEQLKGGAVYVGIKQSKKALQEGNVLKAYVAMDASPHVVDSFVRQCGEAGVDVTYAESMIKLGHSAGIERGAAVAVVLKNAVK